MSEYQHPEAGEHSTLEPLPAVTTSAPIIQVRDLRKVFRVGEVDVHALQGVDLDVGRGEFLSIVGTSGSGKSTLFNILGGLTPPTSGTVEINGNDLASMTDSQSNDPPQTASSGSSFRSTTCFPP